MGAKAATIQVSTNVPRGFGGAVRSVEVQPEDRGAAVYFVLDGAHLVLACDRWDKVEDNLYAIVRELEANRSRVQWGVVSMQRAFACYSTRPAADVPLDGGALRPQPEVVPSPAEPEKPSPKMKKKCGFCDTAGHTRPTCPVLRGLFGG